MSTVMEKPLSTDRIERSVVINAPRERVWNALTNAEEFGAWFGADLKGQQFAVGKQARGLVSKCGHDGVYFDAIIDRIDPQSVMAFRWHPYPVDQTLDYSKEQRTLVTFTLSDAPGTGVRLTVVESGFDKVSPARRAEAFQMNSNGWTAKIDCIVRYVTE